MLDYMAMRTILLAPGPLARAAAPPEHAWMLRQSRRVRESYVREVLDI